MGRHSVYYDIVAVIAVLVFLSGAFFLLKRQEDADPVKYHSLSKTSPAGNDRKISEEVPSEVSRHVFFGFTKGKPTDPQGMKDFGISQVERVADAFRDIPDSPYEFDLLLDENKVNLQSVKNRLAEYAQILDSNDTFVMYSHTHGLDERGLLLDVGPNRKAEILSWDELASALVALPAKNVIIFTMACNSGGLTDALKASTKKWQGRSLEGKNFIVLSSVSAGQSSGRSKSPIIGHPFAYAISTAIQGEADGFTGEKRDGKIDMEELVLYILATAKEKSTDQEHNPQVAGNYSKSDVFVVY